MSLMNLQTYLTRLTSMEQVLRLTKGGRASFGWNTARGKSAEPAASMKKLSFKPTQENPLQTLEVSLECSYEAGAMRGPVISGDYGIWQDKGMNHVLNPDLMHVHDLLLRMYQTVNRNTKNLQPSNYLLHVNDLDMTTAMTRPTSVNYAYLGTQLTLISSAGRAYSFTMDRVSTGPVGMKKFAWVALLVPEGKEIGVLNQDHDVISGVGATGYVPLAGGQLAYFQHDGFELESSRGALRDYLIRDIGEQMGGTPLQFALQKSTPIPSFLKAE